ncbi:restriction endonuclease subunit S [uncultured Bacteroides sp.]|uniref:restriction endonuclease subunit S n=1 Tax=uncultured Bacteroides sp. TaxID=162156 RepID=UPI00280AB227|nr:restriction endonuclease subunit S [uncultured Bacteroides sp.]
MENRYDKYKDSGIAWIGEIPEHWEVKKGKNLFKKEERPVRDNDEIITCFRDGEVTLRSNRRTDGFTNAMKEVGYQGVRRGDLVIHNMDAFAGAIGVSDSNGKSTPVYSVCTPKNNTDANVYYYAYLLRSYALGGVIQSLAKGIRERSTDFRYKEFGDLFYQQPPLSEQQSIATYLDQKCSEIDELITLQEEMITKLQSYKQSVITEAVTKGLDKNVPLKDSGIEWIGEIPKHWKVKRLKFSCNVFGRIGFRGYKSDDLVSEGNGAITLSPSNMKDMKMDYTNRTYLSWKKYYESPEIMISKNDILMVKTGSTYGKCSFVDDIPMECTINPQIVVFKQHKDYPKFLAYSFQTKATRAFVETSVVGGTIPTIAQEKIMNYFFAFPPLSEQQSITDYLDQKCSEIDELISIKQQKIEKLKDYKKSLIFECVTGKRKVS